MLNREIIEELLEEKFKESGIKIPRGFSKKALTETFCKYTEDDYYEWIKDNFRTFFNYNDPDWNWIKERIKYYSKGA